MAMAKVLKGYSYRIHGLVQRVSRIRLRLIWRAVVVVESLARLGVVSVLNLAMILGLALIAMGKLLRRQTRRMGGLVQMVFLIVRVWEWLASMVLIQPLIGQTV